MADDWHDLEPWYNDRILDTYISSDEIDVHGDRISPELFKNILPWLKDYGYYEWQHTGIVIGKILGWKFKDGKPQIRVGIHDTNHSNMPIHDEVWQNIKSLGLKGMSSIKGIANNQEIKWEGNTRYNEIKDMGVFAVGWVADEAANSGANVTAVSVAKSLAEQSKENHDLVCKSFYCHNNEETMTTIEKEEAFALTDKEEIQKIYDDLQVKVKGMLQKLEKAEEPPVDEEPVGDEEPAEEPADASGLEDDINQLATAITALEDGTPEAVQEAVDIATDVLEDTDNAQEPDVEELKKSLAILTEKVVGLTDKFEKAMSKPIRKTGSKPVTPTVTGNSIDNLVNEFQKGKASQRKVWQRYGIYRKGM